MVSPNCGSCSTGDVDGLPSTLARTVVDTDEHVLDALDAGAQGFLLKTTPPNQLVPLVLAAATGASVLSPEALRWLRGRGSADPELDALGERERAVLALVAEGLSNADITTRLYLSEGTVKGHVSRLMQRLGCANRTQLALRASRAMTD